jgi:hypothetical protein
MLQTVSLPFRLHETPARFDQSNRSQHEAVETQTKQTPWLLVRQRTIPAVRPPELVPTFVDKGVSCGERGGFHTAVNLNFLDRSYYFSFHAAPQLSSRGRVGPVPDPLLLRKCGGAGNLSRDLWICSQKH